MVVKCSVLASNRTTGGGEEGGRGLEENISSTNVEVKKQDKQAYTLKLTVTHTETSTTIKRQ